MHLFKITLLKQVVVEMNSIALGRLLLLVVTNSLLVVVVVHGRTSSNVNHALIISSCATTLYPNTCYSTLSTTTSYLATKNDVIQLAINKTKDTLQNNFHTINNLTASTPNLTKRAKIALHDCLQMIAATLERLNMVMQALRTTHPASNNYKSLVITLMSTTITNKETCLDGFSHDAPCKRLRKSIITGQNHWGQMCSNALAMIKNMTTV
ncbi:hypothetical protein L6452_33334 [Arctium lappa]|uniref:Uncharacterized protein n=1 Tax=Arctium lappa TaxID=4217 RepID=A0ACB8YJC5_ARCLA|nr:hypothetical protein L6452_33334 [Arctium lappa]